ncbi:MAG: tRNA uridine-5-carboxymethylaminomethyl(34) synthesis GTPase MnmE [Sphingosinicella sp.]|uniref:tRNA uridine-5-carboxymethylaminomethyl(34) synthesis GTPase MnmE n=1 Tax=Sphingosinicella sp. TaxID=1917971 RepID=UPI004037DB46
MSDTIYALSSGAPPAAIAVVRISGPHARRAVQVLAGAVPKARRSTLMVLRHDSQVLDNALVILFPGPHSATGEDVVELHLHGGRAVVAAVQTALGSMAGLRAAEPGEFTRRAFENGRIDLAEAEGLADLLEAETEGQRRAALSLAGGALSRQVGAWQARLLALAAEVEAALDFSDEGDVEPLSADFEARRVALGRELADWLARPTAERLREGVRVVIAGPPNAGKSSLLNALIGRDAAITSAVPGTTRDLIEAPVSIGGLPFLVVDTAGLRDSGDEIEAIGIARARASAQVADVLLWLGAPADRPEGAITVHTKRDLSGINGSYEFSVSSVTGEGLDELARMLIRHSTEILPQPGEVALNARHRAALSEALAAIDEAGTNDLLIVAEAFRHARGALDRITGRAGVEDMLDALFGRFCIGK